MVCKCQIVRGLPTGKKSFFDLGPPPVALICLLLSSDEFNLQITGWLPVQRGVKIEWDLESTPLEVRTDSVLGSHDQVIVNFFSAGGDYAGEVYLFFISTLHYYFKWCSTTWLNPVTEPSANDKVWRITLTRTAGVRLVIHCNDVEVLDMLLSDATCRSGWSTHWSRDVTKIQFHHNDLASDDYRAGD